MSNNLLFSPPPTDSLFVTPAGRVTAPWQKWFDDVHYLLGTRTHQKVTAATPINLDAGYVSLVTTGASYAVTLGAPTIPGVWLLIEMITRTGAFDVTLSLANCVGGSAATTCTWNTAGDSLLLLSKANKWLIVKEQGVALT